MRRAELLDIQAGLTILDNQKKLQQKTNAKAALIDANNRLAGAQARTAKLPPRETLEELQTRIRAVEAMDIPPAPPEPGAAPDCPEAFRGVPEERLLEQPRATAASSTGSPRSAAVLSFWTCWPSYFLRQPP